MKDIDKLKELIKLAEENPNLEIITMVNYEIVCEDWGYWRGDIGEIKKDFYWQDDEAMYMSIKKIKEQLSESASFDPEFEELPDDKFNLIIEKEIESKLQSGEIKEAIFIYIELP